MILKLNLENFQGHENTAFEFCPGVNAITGQSDSGKSSVLRALNWLINNKPAGDSFIRKGQKNCAVRIQVDDVILSNISKERKSANTKYLMNGEEWKLSDIPDKIKDEINMGEVNIQKQMDAPFLLSESSGEVSRFFNRVLDLEIIDKSLQEVDSRIRETRSQIKAETINFERSTAQLEELDWIDSAKSEASAISLLSGILSKLEAEETGIEENISKIKKINSELESEIDFSQFEKEYSEIISENTKADQLEKQAKDIEQSIKMVRFQDDIISDFEDKNYSDFDADEKKILSIFKADQELTVRSKELAKLISEINETGAQIIGSEMKLKSFEKIYKEKFPDVCPLCGQEVMR